MVKTASNSFGFSNVYAVSIYVDESLYAYFPVASSHLEALQTAIADHLDAGHPLPDGTRCVVVGLCNDYGCACGKMRTKVVFILPETGDSSLTA